MSNPDVELKMFPSATLPEEFDTQIDELLAGYFHTVFPGLNEAHISDLVWQDSENRREDDRSTRAAGRLPLYGNGLTVLALSDDNLVGYHRTADRYVQSFRDSKPDIRWLGIGAMSGRLADEIEASHGHRATLVDAMVLQGLKHGKANQTVTAYPWQTESAWKSYLYSISASYHPNDDQAKRLFPGNDTSTLEHFSVPNISYAVGKIVMKEGFGRIQKLIDFGDR